MPDHRHALLAGTRDEADFRECIRIWKQQSAFEWKRQTGKQLWQEGYFDRVLRPEESDLFVVAYIAGNAVAEGLAESPEAYPLFGCTGYSLDEIRRALAEVGTTGP